MSEEVRMSDFDANGGDDEETTANAITAVVDDDDDVGERVLEWEMGLPSCDDLTPLFQSLIPPELASAFSISPEPRRTAGEVNRASHDTLSSLRPTGAHSSTTNNNNSNSNFPSFNDAVVVEPEGDGSGSGSGSDAKKMDAVVEADSAVRTTENSDDPSGRTLKRPRLVWTPQLHKRFVDVVGHLGIKNAVPKTIMQLMNVEGLTRENVASHLQKYRLYLKRMQGLSNEGPSASDQLFASTPVPPSLHESGSGGGASGGGSDGGGGGGRSSNGNGHLGMAIPMPYGAPMMPVPMPMYGHMGMHQGMYHHQPQQQYHHQQQKHHHHQNGYEANSHGMMHQRDWSSGNRYGSMMSYPHHMAPNQNDKVN